MVGVRASHAAIIHLMDDSSYKVYILRCDDGSLYTGITTDT